MTENIWQMSAWKLIISGGPLMIPILFCSIFALGIAIEKFYLFRKIKIDIIAFKKKIFDLLKDNKIKDALQICDTHPSPVAKILKAGILKHGCSREEMKESIEEISLYEIPKLEGKLSALSTIAHITPLLGILGTVTGMINCFHSIQIRSAAMTPVTSGDLAGGIAEALLTTVGGLMVAVPSYIIYNYFVSRINTLVLEMERAATELINFLQQRTL